MNNKKDYVFIHGYNSSEQIIKRIARLENNFVIHSFDLPGNGKQPATGEISIMGYALYTKAKIEALGLKKVTLVGHSLGCGVAVALNTLKCDFEIERIILVSPLNPFITKYLEEDDMYRLLCPTTAEDALESINKLVSPHAKEIYFKFAQRRVGAFLKQVANTYEQNNYIARQEITNPVFHKTTLVGWYEKAKDKAVVISGDDDNFVPWKSVEKINEEFGIPVHMIEKCGHAAFFEQQDVVVSLLNNFVLKEYN